ncbi:hypothetical protein OA90_01120 [Labrenzia sp. OB1]|nr:hypothetical protein OA90_01120 [Labrenzia sp. OB1]
MSRPVDHQRRVLDEFDPVLGTHQIDLSLPVDQFLPIGSEAASHILEIGDNPLEQDFRKPAGDMRRQIETQAVSEIYRQNGGPVGFQDRFRTRTGGFETCALQHG